MRSLSAYTGGRTTRYGIALVFLAACSGTDKVSGTVGVSNVGSPVVVSEVSSPVSVSGITAPVSVSGVATPVAVSGVATPVAVSGIASPIQLAGPVRLVTADTDVTRMITGTLIRTSPSVVPGGCYYDSVHCWELAAGPFVLTDVHATLQYTTTSAAAPFLVFAAADPQARPTWMWYVRATDAIYTGSYMQALNTTRSITGARLPVREGEKLYVASIPVDVIFTFSGFTPY